MQWAWNPTNQIPTEGEDQANAVRDDATPDGVGGNATETSFQAYLDSSETRQRREEWQTAKLAKVKAQELIGASLGPFNLIGGVDSRSKLAEHISDLFSMADALSPYAADVEPVLSFGSGEYAHSIQLDVLRACRGQQCDIRPLMIKLADFLEKSCWSVEESLARPWKEDPPEDYVEKARGWAQSARNIQRAVWIIRERYWG